ncbi:SGNH/GDSL hydrolase family protein [Nostoc sphaeroides CHAB 2801]|uniref:SGNH/GDSL hydrolase family protein n=1 Tax=Nostoc sphaeroides TaxID=446679 RepID=UPI000E4C3E58|nr:SGNH/GDSL hydrolase family protein [Nostoc sphaeroides]MCC5626957.1 SGNH/GDSL hydrolase family protein [Nostoc sphaeroides CHAB 2801]
MKVALIVLFLVVVGLFVVVEIGLRSLFGFGNPLIYIGDEQIGYLLAPNQRTRRFGNRIEINEYSMRGNPLKKTPASSDLRVLLLGDSIANGGWWTDQTNTISTMMMRSLASSTSNYQEVEVLNASANSWGPRNELAYLEKFSNFNAQAVVLLINTDDLFATAPTSLPIGRDRNYPDSKPPLALVEVWQRYILKQQPIPEIKAVQNEAGDRVGINLEAIAKIQALTRQSNSQFLLVMTPLLREVGEPGPRDYEIIARQRLNDFTKAQQINYIDFLAIFNSTTNPQGLYHDHIHLNLQGNKFVSEVMERSLLEILAEVPLPQSY